jgi:26S proteasome regulatory subunit N8
MPKGAPGADAAAATGGLGATTENSELARAMSIKTNDQLMAIYLSSLIRAITAFHDLIENKIQNRQQAEEKEAKKEEEAKEKEKKNGAVNGEAKDKDSSDKAGDKEKDKGKDGEKKKG